MTETKPNYPPIRRVVTGHEGEVAKVMIDAPATNAKFPGTGAVSTLIWTTDESPAAMPAGTEFEDMGARIMGTPPAPNGTRFAVIDFPPSNKPHMHRTETVDYVLVLEGEIEMDMDDSTVKLKAGDVMVQRGTNHAWANRSKARARVAFVLIDAEPLGKGRTAQAQLLADGTDVDGTRRQMDPLWRFLAPHEGNRLLQRGDQVASELRVLVHHRLRFISTAKSVTALRCAGLRSACLFLP